MKNLLLLALGLVATTASAQYTNRSSVLNGSGTRATGGGYTSISAGGQPGGIARSANATHRNQAGFLNTFLLQAAADADQDGIPDELEEDNDNDGLADTSELGGGAFVPGAPTLVNTADSDGDGVPDGQEAAAGTNPNDADALFALTAITNGAGLRYVAWTGRGNNERTYRVLATPDATQPYAEVIFSNTLAGGSAPWYAVTNLIAEAGTNSARYYAVEVKP